MGCVLDTCARAERRSSPGVLGALPRAAPATQAVAVLNRLNVEIKANLCEKAVFLLSLNLLSGLKFGASPPPPAARGPRGAARLSATGTRGRRGRGARPPPFSAPAGELCGGARQPTTSFLRFVCFLRLSPRLVRKNPLDFSLELFKVEGVSRLVTLATVTWSSESVTFFAY